MEHNHCLNKIDCLSAVFFSATPFTISKHYFTYLIFAHFTGSQRFNFFLFCFEFEASYGPIIIHFSTIIFYAFFDVFVINVWLVLCNFIEYRVAGFTVLHQTMHDQFDKAQNQRQMRFPYMHLDFNLLKCKIHLFISNAKMKSIQINSTRKQKRNQREI